MYNIGNKLPGLMDRVLIRCKDVLWWKPVNINKLPIFFIPVEITKVEEVKKLPYNNKISPSNKYYLGTLIKGEPYVIYKWLDETYKSETFADRTKSMQYNIEPSTITFEKIPFLNIYLIGQPNKVINENDDYSSYYGSVFNFMPVIKPSTNQNSDIDNNTSTNTPNTAVNENIINNTNTNLTNTGENGNIINNTNTNPVLRSINPNIIDNSVNNLTIPNIGLNNKDIYLSKKESLMNNKYILVFISVLILILLMFLLIFIIKKINRID